MQVTVTATSLLSFETKLDNKFNLGWRIIPKTIRIVHTLANGILYFAVVKRD